MLSLSEWLIAGIGLLFAVHLSLFFYHLFINPLRRFPGPKLDATSQLLWSYHLIRGDSAKYISELHEKYGEVVRTASNELSYTTATAWKEIYGNKVGWDNVYEKNDVVYLQGNQERSNIFFAPSRPHARVRKLLAPAFSERAVRDQEYLVQGHVDQMMSSLKKQTGKAYFPNKKGVADMAAWFNFETFDVLSSLAFGAPIGSLESGEYHPWISVIYGAIKHSTFVQAAWRLKPYHKILEWFIPHDMESQYIMHLKNCARTVGHRMTNPDNERKDILSYILNEMPYDDLLDNVNIIVTAGGDTTATTMASVVYYITHNPHAYEALTKEIRESFSKEEDITFAEVAKLKYLQAVINETMRIHPSVPVGLPRIVPRGGRFIDGEFVPGGTWVSVTQLSAYRSPRYFREPLKFYPERWLGDSRFDSDNRDVFHPFSIGARNCIGMSLAISNVRLVITRLLWNFDLESQPENVDPHDLKEFGLWEHRPLNIRLTSLNHAV